LARQLIAAPVWSLPAVPLGVAAIAGLLVATAVVCGPNIYRLFILFAALQLTAALASPAGPMTEPQWQMMTQPGYDGRYFFLPMLAWFASLVVLASMRWRIARTIAIVLMAPCVIGIFGDWNQHVTRQAGFEEGARAFDRADAGAQMTFPINPDGWSMTLTKHPPGERAR
jgi:hypothetical protein